MSALPQPVVAAADVRAPNHRSLLNAGVLVLNRHWTAIHVCTARRALALLFQDLARVVTEEYEAYDFDSWRELSAALKQGEAPVIHTPQFAIRVPEVIVLARYQRVPPRRLKFNRRNIFLRDGLTCQYCGTRPPRDELTIDHIRPRSRGGLSTWENVALACARCNTRKGDRLPEEAKMTLLRRPRQPHWLSCVNTIPGSRGRDIWQRFLDNAYWTVGLTE